MKKTLGLGHNGQLLTKMLHLQGLEKTREVVGKMGAIEIGAIDKIKAGGTSRAERMDISWAKAAVGGTRKAQNSEYFALELLWVWARHLYQLEGVARTSFFL